MDIGALTPPLWGFEEREKADGLFMSGPRARACLTRPISASAACARTCRRSPNRRHHADVSAIRFLKVCDDLEELLTENRIFKQRNVNIGVVTLEDAWARGFSGVMVPRLLGAAWDLRKKGAALCRLYGELDFGDIPVGKNGDNYDRYCASAWEEMRQSVHIMKQCIRKTARAGQAGPLHRRRPQDRAAAARGDEALDGVRSSITSSSTPRRLQGAGRQGLRRRRGAQGRVRRLPHGRRRRSNKPYKCKIRAPGFAHLSAMDFLTRGHMLADVSAILGLARHRVRGGRPMSAPAVPKVRMVSSLCGLTRNRATAMNWSMARFLPCHAGTGAAQSCQARNCARSSGCSCPTSSCTVFGGGVAVAIDDQKYA